MSRYTIVLTPSDSAAASATITVEHSASGEFRVREYAVRPGDGEHADSIPLLDVLLQAVRASRNGASSTRAAATRPMVPAAPVEPVAVATPAEAEPVPPPNRAQRSRPAAPRKTAAAKPAKKATKKATKAKAKRGKTATAQADSMPRRVMPAEFPAALAQTSSTAALVNAFGVPAYTIRYWKQKVAKSQGPGA